MTSDQQLRRNTTLIRAVGWFWMRKFTAGSLIFLREIDGRVALVEPRRAPGQLTFPGGFHRRFGARFRREDPGDAILREVREELGLDLPERPHMVSVYRQDLRPHYDHLFHLKLSTASPTIKRRRRLWTWVELRRVEWLDVTRPDVRDMLIPEARVALREFNRHLHLGLEDV